MSSTAQKIYIGPGWIFFKLKEMYEFMNLGYTKGDIKTTYEGDTKEITTSQTGSTPTDVVGKGGKGAFEFDLITTSLEQINTLFPEATLSNCGTAVGFSATPGHRYINFSGIMQFVPTAAQDGDTSRVVTIHNAAVTGSLDLSYSLENEWIIKVKGVMLLDDSMNTKNNIFMIGNPNAVFDDDVDNSYNPNTSTDVIKNFWIAPSNPTIKVGESVNFSATAQYDTGNTADETAQAQWTVLETDKGYITKNTDGSLTFTATGVGETLISAYLAGYSCNTVITVEAA